MCPKSEQVHAYHDGELSDAHRAGFEAHLQTCADCEALLDELKQLSSVFAQVPLAELPQRSMSRFYGGYYKAREQQERGVRKLAGWMTAAAAAVLAIAFVRHPASLNQPHEPQSYAGGWSEIVAVMPPLEPANGSNAELVQFAQWTASDLSTGETR